MSRKTIEITIKHGMREEVDGVVTWTNQTCKTGQVILPEREDSDFIKFRCFYLVKQLLLLINTENGSLPHQRRSTDDE